MYLRDDIIDCRSFASVVLKPLERAVFVTIFENIVDVPRFEKAIAESLPDKKMIDGSKDENKK